MKKLKLKTLEPGAYQTLSREQLKTVMGGDETESCLPIGASCTASVQCCSNNCVSDCSDPTTGATCQSAIIIDDICN